MACALVRIDAHIEQAGHCWAMALRGREHGPQPGLGGSLQGGPSPHVFPPPCLPAPGLLPSSVPLLINPPTLPHPPPHSFLLSLLCQFLGAFFSPLACEYRMQDGHWYGGGGLWGSCSLGVCTCAASHYFGYRAFVVCALPAVPITMRSVRIAHWMGSQRWVGTSRIL